MSVTETIRVSVEDLETLQRAYASYVGDVYDDPYDLDRGDLVRLVCAGAAIGVDVWDRALLRDLCGRRCTDYEYERLRAIEKGEQA